MRERDEAWMRRALEEASLAPAHGDVPVGAVIVLGDRLLAAAHNERERTGDPTAHAEVLALRRGAEALGTWRLEGTELFVTVEPCPMCAGAIVAARVARVVYGCADPKAGACHSLYSICTDPRLNHRAEVVGGVLAGEAAELLSGFFRERR